MLCEINAKDAGAAIGGEEQEQQAEAEQKTQAEDAATDEKPEMPGEQMQTPTMTTEAQN